MKQESYKKLILLQIVLCVMGLLLNVKKLTDHFVIDCVISCVLYVLIFVYFISGYKKPHGNMLRTVVQVFGTSLGMSAIATVSQVLVSPVLMILCCANINQMSARMDKRDKNVKAAKVVTVLLIIAAIAKCIEIEEKTILNLVLSLTQIIQWVTIMIAYESRYEMHRQAGIEADEKTAEQAVEQVAEQVVTGGENNEDNT